MEKLDLVIALLVINLIASIRLIYLFRPKNGIFSAKIKGDDLLLTIDRNKKK